MTTTQIRNGRMVWLPAEKRISIEEKEKMARELQEKIRAWEADGNEVTILPPCGFGHLKSPARIPRKSLVYA